jgi:hypothetical protein
MVVHVGTEVVRDAAKLMERPLAVAFGIVIANEETNLLVSLACFRLGYKSYFHFINLGRA